MVKFPLLAALLLLSTGARAFDFPIVAALQDLEKAKEQTGGLCKGFGLSDEVAAIAASAGCSLSGSAPSCPGLTAGQMNYLFGKQQRLKDLAQIGARARLAWNGPCPADFNREKIVAMRARLVGTRGIPQPLLAAFETQANYALTHDRDLKMPTMDARDNIFVYYDGNLQRTAIAFDKAYAFYQNINYTEFPIQTKLASDLAWAQPLIAALSPDAAKVLSPTLKAAAADCTLGPKPDCQKVISPALGKQSALMPALLQSILLAQVHRGLTPDAFIKASVMDEAAAKAAFGDEYFLMEGIVVTLENYKSTPLSEDGYAAADKAVATFQQSQRDTLASKQRNDLRKVDLQNRMDTIVTSADRSVIGAGELKPVAADIALAKPGLTCPNNRCDVVWETAIAQANKQLDAVRAKLDSLATAFRALRAKADVLTQKTDSLTSPDKKSAVVGRVAVFKTALADDTLIQGNAQYDALAAYAAQQGVH